MKGYLLLDMTGSMGSNKQATIDACNEYIDSLKADPQGPFEFTIGVFNSNIGLERVVGPCPVDQVRPFGNENYQPAASTPLYDAIFTAISSIPDTETAVMFIIQTDGEENCSQHTTRQKVVELVAEKTKLGWQFAYLGADLDAMEQAAAVGIGAGQVLSYSASDAKLAFNRLSKSTAGYRSSGGKSKEDFMKEIGDSDIRRKDLYKENRT